MQNFTVEFSDETETNFFSKRHLVDGVAPLDANQSSPRYSIAGISTNAIINQYKLLVRNLRMGVDTSPASISVAVYISY